MKPFVLSALLALFLIAGCASPSPDHPDRWFDASLRGPQGTVGYRVKVITTVPGIRLEVNGDYMGQIAGTEGELVLYGDRDGTFHGDGYTVIRALPVTAGQHSQYKEFRNGDGPGDRIPRQLFFDPNLVPVGEKSTLDVNVRNPSKRSD